MDASLVIVVGAAALSALGLTWALESNRGPTPRHLRPWDLVEIGIGLFVILGMLYATTTQVVVRYALSDYLTIPWTDELSRLLLVWSAFWAAAMLQRSDSHIGMDVLYNVLPARARVIIRLFGHLVSLAVLLAVVWYGWLSAQVQFGMATVSLGLPLAAFAFSVPVCGALMIPHTIRLIVRQVQGKPTHDELESGT